MSGEDQLKREQKGLFWFLLLIFSYSLVPALEYVGDLVEKIIVFFGIVSSVFIFVALCSIAKGNYVFSVKETKYICYFGWFCYFSEYVYPLIIYYDQGIENPFYALLSGLFLLSIFSLMYESAEVLENGSSKS